MVYKAWGGPGGGRDCSGGRGGLTAAARPIPLRPQPGCGRPAGVSGNRVIERPPALATFWYEEVVEALELGRLDGAPLTPATHSLASAPDRGAVRAATNDDSLALLVVKFLREAR